jgi:uncharacterized protein YaeQ
VALPSTIHRFHVDLSDVDRGAYEALDLRVARHPSESLRYLLTRVIAYALEYREGLELSRGLCVPEEPALMVRDPTGRLVAWIDVGNPAADRLHKATKSGAEVSVYTYKDPQLLVEQVAAQRVHRAEDIALYSLDGGFLDALAETLGRTNTWGLVRTGGELFVSIGEQSLDGPLARHMLTSG